ncbi:hypothetical protein GOP47_0027775 [Adiantum capillus-veneris]|nr:hypothetical protein GOP47_0027775 [Adiantum capillus-veneris]
MATLPTMPIFPLGEKLDDSNFVVWKMKIMMMLMQFDLWDWLIDTANAAYCGYTGYGDQWNLNHCRVYSFLLINCADSMLMSLCSHTTTHGVWGFLCNMYEAKTPERILALEKTLMDLQILDNGSKRPIANDVDLLDKLESGSSMCTLMLIDEAAEGAHKAVLTEMEKADEELARLLQAEEETLFLQQQSNQDGQRVFASRLEGYMRQVLQYEDPSRQAKARGTVRLDELEEKAVVALAKDGKRNPTNEEIEHCILFQLLLWFKKSFRWVTSPPCFLCGANTDAIAMGNPTHEELQFGGDRVELFRCRKCYSTTRFPRYNDTMKLLETRSGRCGEWANCFTMYCRAFGYQVRLVLDFTDHLWTECFSKFLGRWVHLDPCEGAFDKPLLYEHGWKKKLTYIIAFSKDGVFDVTKRYTKHWEEVRLRRTLTSEENVGNVVSDLTSQLRHTYSQEVLEQLRLRDVEEAVELCRFQEEDKTVSDALPGRLTGSKEWREARGELGSSTVAVHTTCPKRPCVDHFVSQVFLALGELDVTCLKGPSMLRGTLEDLLSTLKKLQNAPYKSRQARFSLNSAHISPLLEKFVETNSLKQLTKALGLIVTQESHNDELVLSTQTPVDTALALPVAIENLENIIDSAISREDSDTLLKQLALFAKNERLSGTSAEASGEAPPLGIASSAFDGLQSTKWEEPEGAKGCWLTYYMPSNSEVQLQFYEVIAANDCPERDPKDWTLEGSDDGGCTWTLLDTQMSQLFGKRFERKCYEVSLDKKMYCNALRLQFQAVRDSSSQSRLQLSCVNFYKTKQPA